MSDAVMVIFCDVADDPAGHDDWHTYEHMHERLSIPGFLRGTRWIRTGGSPRYMIVYEVSGVDMAESPAYLERLNHPTPWTSSTMQRLRGMSRGFCRVAVSAGYGLGRSACVTRFARVDESAHGGLDDAIRRLASLPGMASVHLFEPTATAPMTTEQSIRGRDAEMDCVLLVTAYDAKVLGAVSETRWKHAIAPRDRGIYELAFTATAAEVARTPANPPRR
jgi:hypothetical protein